MGELAALQDQFSPGARVGRYEIIELLTVGGMAEVYLARLGGPHGFEKLVVLKRVLPQLASQDQFIAMFIDEARVASVIHHPNVAQVYDIGEDDASWYIAMEYVRGQNLLELINLAIRRRKRLSLDVCIGVVSQAAAGLHAAHETRKSDGTPLHLVHRDVSPANVLVSDAGCVKLIDFGIAKAVSRLTSTRAGVIKGKYAYMSPEQCRGRPLDRRTDVFSLGIVLYELTTMSRLFGVGGQYDTMRAVLSATFDPPSRRRKNYPRQLEAIVMRALARDPQSRYPTAEALQRDLDAFARSKGLATQPYDVRDAIRPLLAETAMELQSLDERATLALPRAAPAVAPERATTQTLPGAPAEPRGRVVRVTGEYSDLQLAHAIEGEVVIHGRGDHPEPRPRSPSFAIDIEFTEEVEALSAPQAVPPAVAAPAPPSPAPGQLTSAAASVWAPMPSPTPLAEAQTTLRRPSSAGADGRRRRASRVSDTAPTAPRRRAGVSLGRLLAVLVIAAAAWLISSGSIPGM